MMTSGGGSLSSWLVGLFDKELVPVLQLFASSSLALAAFGVAGAALYVNFRNNFGYKPIALVTGYGVGAGGTYSTVSCKFEIWNRRKYPIIVHEIELSYMSVRLSRTEGDGEPLERDWRITQELTLLKWGEETVEPQKNLKFTLRERAEVANAEEPTVRASYFDPRLGRLMSFVSHGHSWSQAKRYRGTWGATSDLLWRRLRPSRTRWR